MDSRKVYHHASIIEMEGRLCDHFLSIFISRGYNYSYICPDLLNKCCLNKEVHEKYWLVQLAI